MALIRLTILLSIASSICMGQNTAYQAQNSGPQTIQGTPVLTTPDVTLTQNGPVYGNPVADQMFNPQTNTANATTGNGSAQSSDFLVEEQVASQQSLGDVARRYRAHEGEQGHAIKTYNEDDLKNLRSTTPDQVVSTPDQTLNAPPAFSPETGAPDSVGGNAALLPQSDQAAETQSNEKPSAGHRKSVVDEVNQHLHDMQQSR
jgi:hypothetical protein